MKKPIVLFGVPLACPAFAQGEIQTTEEHPHELPFVEQKAIVAHTFLLSLNYRFT